MRGLIYKDVCLFFKGAEKRLLLIIGAVVVLLMVKAGIYAGLMASIMLGLTMGMQSVMNFSSDETASWKKYQMTLPVNNFAVVASKYASVVCILVPGIIGSIVLNLISSVVYHQWDFTLYGLSMAIAALLPLAWTAICLPLTYWFGFQSAQALGIVFIFPMFFFIKNFEDEAGFSDLPQTVSSYLLIAGIICVTLFILSYFISVAGYARKE